MITLGRMLGLQTVAEGIEEEGQLARLLDLGCEYGQGYLFAAPVPIGELATALRSAVRIPESGHRRRVERRAGVSLGSVAASSDG
jgi:predicted signal transduction protein with EAL and GGDEF domain